MGWLRLWRWESSSCPEGPRMVREVSLRATALPLTERKFPSLTVEPVMAAG